MLRCMHASHCRGADVVQPQRSRPTARLAVEQASALEPRGRHAEAALTDGEEVDLPLRLGLGLLQCSSTREGEVQFVSPCYSDRYSYSTQ